MWQSCACVEAWIKCLLSSRWPSLCHGIETNVKTTFCLCHIARLSLSLTRLLAWTDKTSAPDLDRCPVLCCSMKAASHKASEAVAEPDPRRLVTTSYISRHDRVPASRERQAFGPSTVVLLYHGWHLKPRLSVDQRQVAAGAIMEAPRNSGPQSPHSMGSSNYASVLEAFSALRSWWDALETASARRILQVTEVGAVANKAAHPSYVRQALSLHRLLKLGPFSKKIPISSIVRLAATRGSPLEYSFYSTVAMLPPNTSH
ncbi:uncharacterized protein MYCGRDRAFT_92307 [Zymoseptoria tritici IPO323]|uniref:Uncharacterized protein n=1 Tax=Zymoseptoria tritici (strain CBS 115943 / IPO323) TaxID=336722 RepID=F9X8Q5_ZYMTI|nr:uncharacterized protein MYCGRDRAFT_92307 [Zymoseptoria tritici IPO323]EGP87820.1 hypothetical protein MYCGRDRAFT_92307 [Zymoseptoria tritici IPO323]